MVKSANQLWKESGTTLSFKDWLNRQKEKYASFYGEGKEPDLILNRPLSDSVQSTLADIKKMSGYKTEASKNTVFGLNKTVLIVAGLVVVGAIAYTIIVNKKK